MTQAAPTYDLVLLLDPQAQDAAREKILADVGSAVQAQGELLRHDDWGERPLAYPLRHRASAQYHLFQFHASQTELLDGLDRSLRIADGVLRFRLIKLKPGVPAAPDMRASSAPARRPASVPEGESELRAELPAEQAEESVREDEPAVAELS